MRLDLTRRIAPLFDRTPDGRAFVPTWLCDAGEARRGQGRPSGRRVSALPWTALRPLARWRLVGPLCLALLCGSLPGAGHAQASAASEAVERQRLVVEAARRFAIPAAWISAVIGVESAGDPRAISPAGAMGLMQVMPRTYDELRARHSLGEDPFDPRDNVMAGAAYLRELYDRFGAPGFLAAYNAGPERYARRLADGRPLPLETRRYVATLAPVILGAGRPPTAAAPPPTIFVQLRADHGADGSASSGLFAIPRSVP